MMNKALKIRVMKVIKKTFFFVYHRRDVHCLAVHAAIYSKGSNKCMKWQRPATIQAEICP